jgi:CxxC motif-containing protein (DUF1111 family)
LAKIALLAGLTIIAAGKWALGQTPQSQRPPAGGAMTVSLSNHGAFAAPAPNLDAAELRVFAFGNRLFNTNWIAAPASAEGFDGLGPSFNRPGCAACHVRDGRGRPPVPGEREVVSMLVRLSLPGRGPHHEPKPVPNYGEQLNDRAIRGVPAEGRVRVRYQTVDGTYADGEAYRLRKPVLVFEALAFGDFPKRTRFSARVAPAVFGLGLLEAVPEHTIRAWVDVGDGDADGISGRPNEVWSQQHQRFMLGRFGWKANVATLMDQNASAALGDLGITTELFKRENCPGVQTACLQAVSGGTPEMSTEFLEKLTRYVQLLAVPAARAQAEPQVIAGEKHFHQLGCASCHRPEMRTGKHELPALSGQLLAPYTDLLLHDMGAGLADGREDFEANGSEWRTAPLWGLGLIKVVNGHQFLLHDGRARGIAEAILWHGGEAQRARDGFVALPKPQREELLTFLESL